MLWDLQHLRISDAQMERCPLSSDAPVAGSGQPLPPLPRGQWTFMSCMGAWSRFRRLKSRWSSQLYTSLQYCVHLFRTGSALSYNWPVSITADLYWLVFVSSLSFSIDFLAAIPLSMMLLCSSIQSFRQFSSSPLRALVCLLMPEASEKHSRKRI